VDQKACSNLPALRLSSYAKWKYLAACVGESLHLLSGRSSASLLYLSGLLSSASLTELVRALEASEPSEPLSRVAVRSSERQIRVRDEGTLLHTGASALRFTGARLKSLAPSVGAHRAYEVPPAG